ncbi:MAG: hypothetical protein CMJ34_06285 [Phycisphaerae bacterium]|nr:hypothetical protein [Phycisphaerae bacterium]
MGDRTHGDPCNDRGHDPSLRHLFTFPYVDRRVRSPLPFPRPPDRWNHEAIRSEIHPAGAPDPFRTPLVRVVRDGSMVRCRL